MAESAEATGVPSVKDLASSEASVRRSCLNNIFSNLKTRNSSSPLSPTESLQLWRGLYVALYMHDSKNPISVQTLIAELASTVSIMDAKDSERDITTTGPHTYWLDTWIVAFWETVCREWASIDQWRMNKVLLLVRFILRDLFDVCLHPAASDDPKTKSSSEARITRQIQVLESWPLSPRERNVPDGLRLHVLDIWIDELEGRLASLVKSIEDSGVETNGELQAAALKAAKSFMPPIERLSKEALSKAVKLRAKEALALGKETLP